MSAKNCLTCKWEPEWFEDVDPFNPCPHCNAHTVGICQKLALIVPVLGQPTEWPDALRNAYSWVEKADDTIYRYSSKDKRNPFYVKNCHAWQPKGEG